MFYILINKFPPERIYVGIIYFFVFYLFLNFEKIIAKSKLPIYLLLSISLLQIILDQNIYREIKTLKYEQQKLRYELDCKLDNKKLLEIEKHLYYYLYLEDCNKKRNLDEFLIFYRKN